MNDSNDQTKTSPITIGKYLALARENKGFSLKKISHQTKISTSILEKLENDLLEQLPNKAYVNGFVRSYGQVLSLNLDECQRILDESYTRNNKSYIPPKKADVLRSAEEKAEPSNFGVFAGAALLLAVGATYLILNNSSKTVKEEKKLVTQELNEQTPLKVAGGADDTVSTEVTEVEPALAQSPAAKPSLLVPQSPIAAVETPPGPMTPVAAPVTPVVVASPAPLAPTITAPIVVAPTVVAPTPKPTTTETKIKEEVKKEEPKIATEKNDEAATAAEALKPMPSKVYDFAQDNDSSKSLTEFVPSNMQNAVVAGKQNVFIAAVEGDTWITYKKDSDSVKKFTLEKGKNILIRGDEIRVFLGNVNVTKIFLNNKLLDLPSRSGVKSLVFPETAASKYKLPLFIYRDNGEVVPSDETL